MSKNYMNFFIRFAFITMLFFGWSINHIGQTTYTGESARAINSNAQKMIWNDTHHSAQFIQLITPVPEQPEKWINNLLGCSGPNTMRLKSVSKEDRQGYIRFVFQHYHNNFRVENSIFYVHTKNGLIEMANGTYYAAISLLSGSNMHSVDDCKASGISYLKEQHLHPMQNEEQTASAPTELVIRNVNGGYFQCYKFDLRSIAPFARKSVYVDAFSGQVVFEMNQIICTDTPGTANTRYSGTRPIVADSFTGGYRLRDNGRGISTWNLEQSEFNAVDFVDDDNNWTSTADNDDAAFDVHWGLEATYDYYLNTHGRTSFDDMGAHIDGYAHYTYNYTNAFWDGTAFYFGDGDPNEGFTPLTSMDVVAHEYTHAVTQYSAGLEYQGESGALNESYSDIFGVVMDYETNPLTANFFMGELINNEGVVFRDMTNPNLTLGPDTYLGLYWDPFEEVHTNSQVMNHWFYLLCNGGTGTNDVGDSFGVVSIAMDAAADIAYRALTTYLTPTSNYSEAREFTIQSAIDLFGACSEEVIQVTNAWYAVGIGELSNQAVVAVFSVPGLNYCDAPATVSFTNFSVNATSYLWNFGDGITSTEANPTHIYSVAGTYTITLTATGSGICGASDQLVLTNYLNISDGGSSIAASCSTNNTNASADYGIAHVNFGDIHHGSGNALEDYVDNSCTYSTTLVAGESVPIQIYTGAGEYVKVWIDYNNDGSFDNTTELAFSSDSQQMHYGMIQTSVNSILNTPLRMRISDDSGPITNSCGNPVNGQTEDYAVIFIANSLPPLANFEADQIVAGINEAITFSDISVHVPTSWNWSFPGGNPSTSTDQYPVVSYSSLGTYTVTLQVTNAFGNDTEIKINYINIQNASFMCDDTGSSASHGTLYDSGGLDGSYLDYEYCTFLIEPAECAGSITLNLTEFNTEADYDYLGIYDGPDASGPSLFYSSGTTNISSVTANSGAIFIVWNSDETVTFPGFILDWSSESENAIPMITVSEDCLFYGNTVQLETSTQTLTVHNSGCDTLFIENISTNSGAYVVGSFPSYILPQNSAVLEVSFTPVDITSYDATLTILNNSEDMYICLTGQGTVGIEEIKNVNNISLYPNPTTTESVLELNILEPTTLVVELLDITGKLEKQIYMANHNQLGAMRFSIDPVSPGVHFVRIKTLEGNVVVKLVKM
jgi:Zn-dependent metalloprotease